jgi:phosphopantothenoylcysteine synthetase/decarboxylase
MSFSFTLAKKYVIKNLQFLIEAPPTRPANAYSRFVSQQLKGKVGISVSKAAPDLAIQWKHIEPEKKAPLEN